MRKRFRRPSPALAISLIALFVAMGGTSYGLARNSIDSREIRNNDVRSSDIRNNDIRSKDVRNGALLSKDFKAGQLPAGAQGATGAPGPRGLQGFQGVQGLKGDTGLKGNPGAPGAPGISGLQRVSSQSADNSTSNKNVSVDCPGSKKVVGTAASLTGDTSGVSPNQIQNVVIGDTIPQADLSGVLVFAGEVNAINTDWQLTGVAICANVAP